MKRGEKVRGTAYFIHFLLPLFVLRSFTVRGKGEEKRGKMGGGDEGNGLL